MRLHPTLSSGPFACLFDLDGTLVDTERENAESIEIVLAARGRRLSDEEKSFVVGHGWREIYRHLHDAGGVDLSFDELKSASAIAKTRLCDERGLRVIPRAADFVRRAAEATGGRCAIVSGSSRHEIAYAIAALSIGDSVRFFVGAEDVAAGKPSPEGYLLAAGRLEVAPASCLVFEDSTAGIDAARAAGMRCVAITAANFDGQDQSRADERVRDFTDYFGAHGDLCDHGNSQGHGGKAFPWERAAGEVGG